MQHFNKNNIQAHFNHAAVSYDEAAVLQRTVATDVIERLTLTTTNPKTILDMGAGTGILTKKVIAEYPKANIIAMDLSENMLTRAQQNLDNIHLLDKLKSIFKPNQKTFICADANSIPLADNTIDLIVSNLMLQWCDDLDKVLAEFRRVLKPDALLMVTSFGPDTLKELRKAWAEVDDQEHVNTFIDMHDFGDALIRNGFGQPVMDVEHFTLTYQKPIGVLKDLKAIGATSASKARRTGLMGKNHFASMLNAYEKQRSNNLIPATYEVIHGHAWAAQEIIKGPTRDRSGVYEISLEEFGKTTGKRFKK
jgi:malonyl-CoA O-methyltransferase